MNISYICLRVHYTFIQKMSMKVKIDKIEKARKKQGIKVNGIIFNFLKIGLWTKFQDYFYR